MIEVPIFHVNGEDPEAVVYVAELAMDFRETFGQDVVIDMVCYRRHGHNEGDEPAFTQPLMYRKIKDRPSVQELYTESLIMTGDLSADEAETIAETFREKMQAVFDEVHNNRDAPAAGRRPASPAPGRASRPHYSFAPVETGVPRERSLNRIAEATVARPRRASRPTPRSSASWPPAPRRCAARRPWTGRPPRRWPSARSCWRSMPVRLSGQDSRRGTFSQRHAMIVDSETGEKYYPAQEPRRRPGRVLRRTTASCPRPPCWASTTATRWTSRTC